MPLPAMERDISAFLDNASTIEFLKCRKQADVHNFKETIRCARLALLMNRLHRTKAYALGCSEKCTVETELCDETGTDWFKHWSLDPALETGLEVFWSVMNGKEEHWLDFLRRQLGVVVPPALKALCNFLETCPDKTYHWLPDCEGHYNVLLVFKYNRMSGSVFFSEDWVDPMGFYM